MGSDGLRELMFHSVGAATAKLRDIFGCSTGQQSRVMGLNKGKIISREALVEEVGLKMLPKGYY